MMVIGMDVEIVEVLIVKGVDNGMKIVKIGEKGEVIWWEIENDGGKEIKEFIRIKECEGRGLFGKKLKKIRGKRKELNIEIVKFLWDKNGLE